MRHAFEIDATPHEVWLGRESGEYILHLDNERLPVSLSLDDQGHGSLRIDGETVPITLARRGDDCFIHLDGSTWQLRYRDPLERASALAHGSHDDDIRAPMPGTTISVRVAPGDAVLKGATLLVMESMKLETAIIAPRDAVVVSVRVAVGQAFERDALRCTFDRPQRAIALTYVLGMVPRDDFTALNININPGVGELVHFPALTHSGPCDIINIESVPGGPMDRWDAVKTPAEHLAMTKALIAEFFPWEAPRFENIRLTDDNGTLFGRVAPTVRHAIGVLPSGRKVLGMGDILVLNDPMTGQGSNNAAKGASMYLDAIVAQGSADFDDAWMDALAARYWDYAQWSARFTNSMLVPPPPHVMQFLGSCAQNGALAGKFADAFNDPKSLASWFYDPEATRLLLENTAIAA